MKLPMIKVARERSAGQIVAFRGINYAEGAEPGELRDSLGLTAQHYPFLATRPGRITDHNCAVYPSNALFAWNKLVEVEGNTLYYDNTAMCTVESGPKQFAVVNNKLIVWPDKLELDMDNLTLRDFSQSVTSVTGSQATYTANSIEISPYVVVQTGVATWAHQTYEDMYHYHKPFTSFLSFAKRNMDPDWDLEFSKNGTASNALRVGSKLAAQQLEMGGYAPITRTSTFCTGDNHNIEWSEQTPWNGTPVASSSIYLLVTSITYTEYWGEASFLGEGERILWYDVTMRYQVVDESKQTEDLRSFFQSGDRITIQGSQTAERVRVQSVTATKITLDTSPFSATQNTTSVTISHAVPDLDFICAKDNRLWGFSNDDQTIYSSALGLPMEFFDYAESSDASYAVAIISPGDVTGMITYSGSVLLWKPNLLYKMMGDYPANYAYYVYNVDGVAKGSHGSQCIINEVLYYLGEEGVYAYTGGVPQLISQNFGTRRFSNGVAGSDGTCLLLSMQDDSSKEWGLYTYDTLKGIWLKEDDIQVTGFARLDKHTYMLSKTDNALFIINEGTNEQVEWMAEFAPMNEGISGHKGYTKLWLRLNMDPGAWMMVETQQDRGPWKRAWTQECTTGMTIKLPLMLGRCDRFAIRLTGKGGVTIEGMIREYLVGSDVK